MVGILKNIRRVIRCFFRRSNVKNISPATGKSQIKNI